MKANIFEISNFIETELNSPKFKNEDYSFNGLQLDFNFEIQKIAASVDVGVNTIKLAASQCCQLLVVHHGLFWKRSNKIFNNFYKTLEAAKEHKISIIAQHLPLDASEKYGNNFLISKALGLKNSIPSALLGANNIGCKGENLNKLNFSELVNKLELELSKESKGIERLKSFSLNFGPKIPEKVCIVSGSGCDELYRYIDDDFDTLITGEPRQFIYHFCKDNKLNVICAGHYATETLGVKSITREVAKNFNIDWEFIDEPTGI